MTLIEPPSHYVEVEPETFESFLRQCPDYRRIGYVGAVRYWFAHNEQNFAVVVQNEGKETVFVDPSLLEP